LMPREISASDGDRLAARVATDTGAARPGGAVDVLRTRSPGGAAGGQPALVSGVLLTE